MCSNPPPPRSKWWVLWKSAVWQFFPNADLCSVADPTRPQVLWDPQNRQRRERGKRPHGGELHWNRSSSSWFQLQSLPFEMLRSTRQKAEAGREAPFVLEKLTWWIQREKTAHFNYKVDVDDDRLKLPTTAIILGHLLPPHMVRFVPNSLLVYTFWASLDAYDNIVTEITRISLLLLNLIRSSTIGGYNTLFVFLKHWQHWGSLQGLT